jgi:hypothetical protein
MITGNGATLMVGLVRSKGLLMDVTVVIVSDTQIAVKGK